MFNIIQQRKWLSLSQRRPITGILILIITLLSVPEVNAQLADPTRPSDFNPANAATHSAELSLDAIFYSAKSPRAIINGQTVQPGATIAGFKLIQIKPHAVLLKGPDGTFELPLLNLSIKRTDKNGAALQ